MTIEKTVIAKMSMPYAVGSLLLDGKPCVACATEDHGPAVFIAPPYRAAQPLVSGPGGCMALVPDPASPGSLFAIMGCFVGYRFEGAGIYRIRAGGPDGWTSTLLFPLPFAHRIELVDRPDGRWLFAASLAEDKADPADWSKPGSLYTTRLSAGSEPLFSGLETVLTDVHKNHGLLRTRFEGRSSLLLGAAEGLFAIDLESAGPQWPTRRVLDTETSEIAVFDIDDDGADELVTIEPFHGSSLRVYKKEGQAWVRRWEAHIDFGHCVLAARIGGLPSILVSNRMGSRDLVLFQFEKTSPWNPSRIVIDPGAGAANMLILIHDGSQRIFSANQAAGEIVAYAVT